MEPDPRGRVALLGVWDARVAWAGDGAQSGPGWVAARTEQARGAVSGEIRVARGLRSMPVTEKAFLSGDLGSRRCGSSSTSPATSPTPTPTQRRSWWSRSRRCASTRSPSCWPAGALLSTATAKKHALRASTGTVPERLAAPAGRVAHRRQPHRRGRRDLPQRHRPPRRELYRAEKAEADANGEKVKSTAAQRRHDALLELLLQATAAGDTGNDVNVPAITAVIDVTKLPGAKPAEIVGETEAGTPVTAQTALRWCCDAGISRVLTGPDSTPIDLGHTARLPNRAQRRALAARDRGCTFPGCDRPPGWTSAHHITHWVHGGPTSLWNQTLLCSFHHHRVHEGGFGLNASPTAN